MNDKFFSAIEAKKKSGEIPVIPDIKRRSPKEGDLIKGRDPVEMAKSLSEVGVPAISVVTEQEHFGGSLEMLERISQAVALPILRKDFITSVKDLELTKAANADAVLLICAKLSFGRLAELYAEAIMMGLEPLVEAHTREELKMAEELDAKLVGINNRNILQFELDEGTVTATEALSPFKPRNSLLISESSMMRPVEAQKAIQAGADAVLVGTALWQAENAQKCYLAFAKGTGEVNR